MRRKVLMILVVTSVFILPVVFVIINGIREVSLLNQSGNVKYVFGSLGNPENFESGEIIPSVVLDGMFYRGDKKKETVSSCKEPFLYIELGDIISEGDPLLDCNNRKILSNFKGELFQVEVNESVHLYYYDHHSLTYRIFVEKESVDYYNRDFENESVRFQVAKVAHTISDGGLIEIIYNVTPIEDVRYYVNDKQVMYFFEKKAVFAQMLVPKTAVFIDKSQLKIRLLNKDGSIIGDHNITILHTTQGQYSVAFEEDVFAEHFDWSYGIYRNSIQNGEENDN